MSPEETRESERARALATWVDDRDEGGRLRPLPDELDLDAGQAIVALRPDLAPGPYVDEADIVALLDEHERLEAFLAGGPGDTLDPDLRAAAVAMRPERAPAPKVSIDDILARVNTGPFAFHGTETEARPDGIAFHGTETEIAPIEAANAPAGHGSANRPKGFAEPKALEGAKKVRRRGWLPWLMAGGGTAGFATLVMAAVALFVLVPNAQLTTADKMAPMPVARPITTEPIPEASAPEGSAAPDLGVVGAVGGGEARGLGAAPRTDAPAKTPMMAKEATLDATVAPAEPAQGLLEDKAIAEVPAAAPPPPPPVTVTAGTSAPAGGGGYGVGDSVRVQTESVALASKPKAEREEKRVRGAAAPSAPAANMTVDEEFSQTGAAEEDLASARDDAQDRQIAPPALPAADAERIRALEAEAEQLAAAGKFAEAATKLAPAIGTNAGIAHWYGAKVARWQLTGGSAVAAEATCKKALTFGKSSPQAPALYLVYGDVLDRLGRDAEAQKAWESAAY